MFDTGVANEDGKTRVVRDENVKRLSGEKERERERVRRKRRGVALPSLHFAFSLHGVSISGCNRLIEPDLSTALAAPDARPSLAVAVEEAVAAAAAATVQCSFMYTQ